MTTPPPTKTQEIVDKCRRQAQEMRVFSMFAAEDLLREAADTLERQKLEVEDWAARAETAEDTLENAKGGMDYAISAAMSEAEELRSRVKELEAELNVSFEINDAYVKDIAVKRVEASRYREALEWYADQHNYDAYAQVGVGDRARSALTPAPKREEAER